MAFSESVPADQLLVIRQVDRTLREITLLGFDFLHALIALEVGHGSLRVELERRGRF